MADRLSPLDASFLARETTTAPLHAGGVAIFARGDRGRSEALRFGDVLRAMEDHLDEQPRLRQRVEGLGSRGARPLWVDDPDFDLAYHVRHAALPAPGDRGQLAEFVSRLVGRPLDRARPLWELYVIEGLEGGETAIFRKTHLALNADPLAHLLTDTPGATSGDRRRRSRWEPQPSPTPLARVVDSARGHVEQALSVAADAVEVATSPRRLVGAVGSAANAAAGVLARVARGAPPSPLNQRLSPHRRFAMACVDLDALRTVRRAFGGEINDIVVAVTGDAIGRLLRWRGYDTKDLDLKVMVPVRVHDGAGGAWAEPTLGEGAVGVVAPLPVLQMDPVARLYRIRGEMGALQGSRQAVAAESLMRLAGFAPATLHVMASRLVAAEQRYNVALSNAPGPQQPRYLGTASLRETYPFIPLAGNCALSVAVSSYSGSVYFGFLGDRDALADIDLLTEFLVEAVTDLVTAAEKALD